MKTFYHAGLDNECSKAVLLTYCMVSGLRKGLFLFAKRFRSFIMMTFSTQVISLLINVSKTTRSIVHIISILVNCSVAMVKETEIRTIKLFRFCCSALLHNGIMLPVIVPLDPTVIPFDVKFVFQILYRSLFYSSMLHSKEKSLEYYMVYAPYIT